MNSKEYPAELRNSGIDPNEHLDLGEVVAILEVLEQGEEDNMGYGFEYLDDLAEGIAGAGDTWGFLVRFEEYAGEEDAGWIAYHGLYDRFNRVRQELQTQELLNGAKQRQQK